jgi:hypothetical protein
MQTKLTLRLDQQLVRPEAPVSPAVRSLIGVLRGRQVSGATYRAYLEAKHR